MQPFCVYSARRLHDEKHCNYYLAIIPKVYDVIVRCTKNEERYRVCCSLNVFNDPSNVFSTHIHTHTHSRQSEPSCSIINIYLDTIFMLPSWISFLSRRRASWRSAALLRKAGTVHLANSNDVANDRMSILWEPPVSKFTVRSRRYKNRCTRQFYSLPIVHLIASVAVPSLHSWENFQPSPLDSTSARVHPVKLGVLFFYIVYSDRCVLYNVRSVRAWKALEVRPGASKTRVKVRHFCASSRVNVWRFDAITRSNINRHDTIEDNT